MEVGRIVRCFMVAAISAALPICCTLAEAQQAPASAANDEGQSSTNSPPQADQSQGNAGDQLLEVVVTAERRTLDLQTTPISIQAISGTALQDEHLSVVADLQNVVPNMQVNTQGMGNNLEVRGVGTTAFIPTIVSGVGVFKDGMYEPSSVQLNDSFFDLVNTQVLRGPQGTFGGFASIAGELDINSASPNLRGLNGYIEANLGNYSDQKVDGAVNLPVSDTFAMRIAFLEETRNSFYRDIGSIATCCASTPGLDPGSDDSHSIRLGALWKPTDNFTATIKWEYNTENTGGFTYGEPNPQTFTIPAGQRCRDGTAGPTCHSPYYAYSTGIPFVLNYSPGDPLANSFRDSTATVELRWTLPGDITFRSLTGIWQDWWTEQTGLTESSLDTGYFYADEPTENHYQQEFDLISPTTGKVQWVAGATWFYRNAPATFGEQLYLPPGSVTTPETIVSASNAVFHAEGIFANVNWQMTKSLQLQIGARENADNNSTGPLEGAHGLSGQVALPGTAGLVGVAPGFVPCVLIQPSASGNYGCVNAALSKGKYADRVPTGKVGLNWTPLPGQYIFAFYARGYQPGGYNGTSSFKPAYMNDYELGWKSTAFDRHLQTSINAFYMNYQNMQVPLTDLVTGVQDNLNLPASTIKGIEFQATGRAGAVSADLSASYTESALGRIIAIAAYELPPGITAATQYQCSPAHAPPNCTNYVPYYTALSGENNAYTPKFQGSLGVNYVFALGGDATLTPRVLFSYTSSQYASIFQNSSYYYMGPRHLLSAFLTYQIGQWQAQLYGTNLTDQIYLSGLTGANVFYGSPRQYGVSLRRGF